MPKKALSVTLDEANVLWLKGRAKVSGGNVSEALDVVITRARQGKLAGLPAGANSLVGMIDLSDDPDLLKADAAVREWFEEYLSKPFLLNEDAPAPAKPAKARRRRG